MTIHEKLNESERNEQEEAKQQLALNEETINSHRRRINKLTTDKDFVWFYKEYILKPAGFAYEKMMGETTTNGSFIAKGEVKAYNKVATWKPQLLLHVTNLVTANKHLAEIVHGDTPSQKPEN